MKKINIAALVITAFGVLKKKINIAALVITVLGVLTLFIMTVFFNFYIYFDTFDDEGNEVKYISKYWDNYKAVINLETAGIVSNITAGLIALGILLLLISRDKKANENFSGILFIALGVIAVIGSLGYFHPCMEMMPNNTPMRCYWTMKVLLGVAGAVSITGIIMLLLNKSRDFIKGLNCSVIILSCLFVLIPLKMTGLCSSNMMDCVIKFRSFILMMSSIMIASSVINAFLLNKKERPLNRKMNKK